MGQNSLPTDLVTAIEDSALNLGDERYEFTYDDEMRLAALRHPEGYTEEYFYDSTDHGRMTTQRDVDGGVTSYTYDSDNRISSISDPWGKSTTYTYGGSNDAGPLGAVKEILYSNGAKAQYAYGASNAGTSAGRLVSLLNRAGTSGNPNMDQRYYTYDANGNITDINLGTSGVRDILRYQYDSLNRLTRESRILYEHSDETER